MAKHLDPELVKNIFNYDPYTGILTLRIDRGAGGKFKAGDEVGTIHESGVANSKKYYLRTWFDGSYVYIHRLAYVGMTGKQPKDIDHINGDGLNNKWDNLRSVTHRINGKNQKIHTTNTSGTSGVTYRKDSGRWRARIMVDDIMINLGTFKDKNDAIEARKRAEGKYGYDLLAKR